MTDNPGNAESFTGGDTAPLTAAALPQIVHGLRARGLRLATISQLLRAA